MSKLQHLPKNWEVGSLASVASVIDPHPSHRAPIEDANGIPFGGIGDFDEYGNLRESKVRRVPEAIYEEHKSRYQITSNTIGFGRVASIGKIIDFKGFANKVTISPTLAIVEPHRVEKKFLVNALKSLDTQDQIALLLTGSTRSSLGIALLRELILPLPPLPEQKKIAAILTSVDDVIEKTQAQIDKLKDLKTGMMQELLTRGVGVDGNPHTEFKDSPVGRIPKGWEVEVIGNIFSVQLGKMLSKASKITDSPLPYLGNKNIQWGRVVLDDLERMDFSEKEKKKFSLEAGDLLMCEGGDVGRCAIWMNEMSDCYYQKAIHRLRPVENKYKPVLLMEYMKFAKESGLLVDYISQTSIAHLTKEKLISIPIPVPSIVEQESIVKVLKALSNRLKVAENKLEQNKKLKKALMQDLLTGKVRVKVEG